MTAKRILVVDDEPQICEILELSLRHRGFDVLSAHDGPVALEVVSAWHPDAIVLDVMLPKVDGFALLPKFRRLTEAPILMLTAKADVGDRVNGLRAGADDYVGKPFEVEELIWRIESALRRPRLEHPAAASYADIHVDLDRKSVTRAGKPILLTAAEYALLVFLVRNPERVFTREQLLDRVWGDERDVTPAVAERYVSYLRAKIDQGFAQRLIVTVRNLGYCLRGG